MFIKKFIRHGIALYKFKNQTASVTQNIPKYFYISTTNYADDDENKNKNAVAIRDPFDDIKDKNKNTYLQMINFFVNSNHVYRRGHVEFIYSALNHMEEFGVHKDLEVYKSLIDILPKGKFIPSNIIQAEFMHYPKQQQCMIDLLQQMEENNVMPDYTIEDQLIAIFGRRAHPVRRFWRMMYWMPKWKYASPFPLPDPLPADTFELAKLAIERISNVDPTNQVTIYQTADIKDSIDDTWIVSAQSLTQKRLCSENKTDDPVFVEGAFTVFLKGYNINYFILRGKARPFIDDFEEADNVEKLKPSFFNFKPPVKNILKVVPTVHEQEDGVIYAICATGTSSKDSLLSWIRHLEIDGNPNLTQLPIVFTLKSGTKEIVNIEVRKKQKEEKKIEDK